MTKRNHRINLSGASSVAVAIAICAFAPFSVASAQNSSPTDEPAAETVVVQGYRQSLQSAVNSKRVAINIVDVIKADDMASFPDANLAESIQRIPGVSITRDGGEGRSVTVRGLGGEFVRTTLNGFEAYSATTGSTLGVLVGINRSRGFDYSTFASELFNSVTVNKSQSAEMDEGSLAATIDLQTARPFDKKGFRGAASMSGAYYDNNSTYAPRVAALVSNTWGNFGALLSVAYSTRKAQEEGYSDTSQSDFSDALNGFCGVAVDIPTQAGSQVVNTAIPYVNALSGSLTGAGRPANQCFSGKASDPIAYAKINQPNVFLPRNPGLGRFNLDQTRLGITNSYQWRPNDKTRVDLDIVFSRFEQDRTDYALSLASNNRNVNGASAAFPLFAGRVDTQIMDVNVDANGQVDYMRLNNVDIKHIQEKAKTTTDTHSIGFNVTRDFENGVSLNYRVGHSGSDYDQPYSVLMSYDAFNKDGYVWDSRQDKRRPYINYGYDPTNAANVTFTNAGTGLTPDIRITKATVLNELLSNEVNLGWDVNSGLRLKAGAMIKNYDFKTTQTQRLFPNNGSDLTRFNFAKFAADFPNLATLSENFTGFGKQLDLPANSVTGWIVPNVDAFIEKVGILCNCANQYGDFSLAINSALGNNRSVSEKDTAFYVQGDFDNEIKGHRVRGNLGVRYVKTEISATGYLSLTQRVTVDNEYEDLLPSLNVSLDVTPNLVSRFAFAGVMARPGLGNLNPGGALNTNFGAQSATIGNPLLKPYRARNYDFSLEWYPSKGSIVSATAFYKDVQSSIQNLSNQEPFSSTGLPLSLLPTGQDGSTIYTVTRSRNTEGGYIKGLELNVQKSLDFLPGIFSKMGVAANYTYVDSSVLYYLSSGLTATTTKDQFVNVSPNSYNATLYYDDNKLSARVSVAKRDPYLVALPFKAEVADGFGSYATTNVDASASYQLTPRLKITFDALNLTNQAADQWSGATRLSTRVYSLTGRQFFLGASYLF